MSSAPAAGTAGVYPGKSPLKAVPGAKALQEIGPRYARFDKAAACATTLGYGSGLVERIRGIGNEETAARGSEGETPCA